MAGAYYGRSNNSYYLFRGKTGNNNYNWWTMSPSYSNYLWVVSSDGSITLYPNTQTNIYVRPVIVLRSDVTVSTGNGSSSEPYVIE